MTSIITIVIGEKRCQAILVLVAVFIGWLTKSTRRSHGQLRKWAAYHMLGVWIDQGNNNAPYRDFEIPAQIIGKEQTSRCFKGIVEGLLHSPAAYHHPGWYSEVILIVFPCEAIRSRDILTSQCTTLTTNIYQTSSLYSKSIGSYKCYYTVVLCWVHRNSVLCWENMDIPPLSAEEQKKCKISFLRIVLLAGFFES